MANPHASTSPGPINCNIRLRLQGERYPRSCERCGIFGPCPFFNDDGSAKGGQVVVSTEMEDKAPLLVRRYIFNQYSLPAEDDDSGQKNLVAQKEVWAQSRNHAMNLVKKLHGKKFWYEYQGVEVYG